MTTGRPGPTSLDGTEGRLTPSTRSRALESLSGSTFDVIVVGGGVTGAGAALDAASRGLRTALVERVDLAAGTSRWSSKLVHGGLRYLAHGDVAVAWESCVERHHLMTRIAPHLTRTATYLVPLGSDTAPAMGVVTEAGIRLADGLRVAARTSGSVLAAPRRLGTRAVLDLAPGLRRDGLRGAIAYQDGQLEDDARLVIALARTAALHGAHIVTRCTASDLGEDRLTLRDDLTGESFEARGQVISATGVWAADHAPGLRVTPSRGSHLVVPSAALGHPGAVITSPVPGHLGRYVFAIPQTDDVVLIGLTDEEAPGVDGIAPPVPEQDEHFLLDTISRALAMPLTSDDVVGRFAGLRPLVSREPTSAAAGPGAGRPAGAPPHTADVSRRHLLLNEPGAPITIAGGKLTTYRRMAQDAVDAVTRRRGLELPCLTETLPLLGAAHPSDLARAVAPARLLRRYGTQASAVLELAAAHPWLADPVAPEAARAGLCRTIGAELLYGALEEGAMNAADLLERRTRVTLVDSAAAEAAPVAQRVLELAAQLLDC